MNWAQKINNVRTLENALKLEKEFDRLVGRRAAILQQMLHVIIYLLAKNAGNSDFVKERMAKTALEILRYRTREEGRNLLTPKVLQEIENYVDVYNYKIADILSDPDSSWKLNV